MGAAGRQRVGSAEGAPRGAAVPVAAEQLEAGDVGVALDGSEGVRLRAGAGEGAAGGADLRLRIGGTAVRGGEADRGPGLGGEVGERECAAGTLRRNPLGRRARVWGGGGGARAGVDQ